MFQGKEDPPCTFYSADIWGSGTGCPPDGVVNFTDIAWVVDAYQGGDFPCDMPCDDKSAGGEQLLSAKELQSLEDSAAAEQGIEQ